MNDFDTYEKLGFEGFKPVSELMDSVDVVPDRKGIYMVLRVATAVPVFVEKGTGGFFKGKNPNVAVQKLEKNWIEGEPVLYIGKAGGTKKKKDITVSVSKATLQSRVAQYMRFGQGESIGHWGGRLIWQLEDAKDLVVCWKVLEKEEPREEEKKMIQEFKEQHDGKRPFANLRD